MDEMTDIELIGYCEIHCATERALFAAEHVNRMIELAGNPPDFRRQSGWVSAHGEMQELCDLARARLVPPAPAIAPPVAAGSVDTPEFGKLLHSVIDYPQNWAMYPERRQKNRIEFIAHINVWGAQQRHEGFREGVAQLQQERDNLLKLAVSRREWAEKAEAELESWVHTNRVDELQRNYSAALARIMYLEAELRIAQSC